MKDRNICKKCGRPIAVICWGVYRKAVVDPEAIMVAEDPDGEEFVRVDGSKIKGRAVDFEDGWDAEPAYRMHRKTCGVKA